MVRVDAVGWAMDGPVLIWRLRDVALRGRTTPRVASVSVDIPAGITALLGVSGAGKTSMLNLLVGYERPTSGQILREPFCSAATAHAVSPDAPLPSNVSQRPTLPLFWSPPDHGLWPHCTVRDHLRIVHPLRGTRNTEVLEAAVDRLLDDFGLQGVAAATPPTLSLGERSRLSVARAVASQARVLVLDEPFAHVDSPQQVPLWRRLIERIRQQGQSLVFATHQPQVVLAYADWVLCLSRGAVLACGEPAALYHAPPDRDVAELLGPCNWFDAEAAPWLSVAERCIRPERLAIEPAHDAPFRVESTQFRGDYEEVLLCHASTGATRRFLHRPPKPTLRSGQSARLRLLAVLWLLVVVMGCKPPTEVTLPLRDEAVWTLPPEGVHWPAPRAITASSDGELFVLDNAGRVLVLDEQGVCRRRWWMPEYRVGKPERVLVRRNGTLAIADTHYHRVVLFDPQGTLVGMFGRKGEGPGEFIYPIAIAEDDRGRLYVCEYGGHDRVQVFQPDGEYLAEFGSFGTGPGQFQRPSGILWRDHRLYIVDAFNNRLQVFHEDGRLVALGPEQFAAELHYPYDIAACPQGSLYVVEYGAGRVTRFSVDGTFLGRYGRVGDGSGALSRPWGLTVDRRGRVLIADTDNRRIVAWQFAN
jgi:iron(III) transport system ATP-binding protein